MFDRIYARDRVLKRGAEPRVDADGRGRLVDIVMPGEDMEERLYPQRL